MVILPFFLMWNKQCIVSVINVKLQSVMLMLFVKDNYVTANKLDYEQI